MRTAKTIGQRALGLLDQVYSEYTKTFEDNGCELVYLDNNFIAMELSADKIFWLATCLNKAHSSNYLVINLSGGSYRTLDFEGPVLDIAMGTHLPPLDVLVRLCASVHTWLDANEAHVVAAHCDSTYKNTAVFFSCYQRWSERVSHPEEARDICSARLARTYWPPSLRRYLGYFELIKNGFAISSDPLRLGRIVVLLPAKLCLEKSHTLEVWQGSPPHLVFTSHFEGRVYCSCESSFGFDVAAQVLGDVSVQIVHPGADKSVVMSLTFHTAFTDVAAGEGTCLRFAGRELDGDSALSDASIDIFLESLDQHLHDSTSFPLRKDAGHVVNSAHLDEFKKEQELFRKTALQVQSAQAENQCASLCQKLGVDPGPSVVDAGSFAADEFPTMDTRQPPKRAAETPQDIDIFFAELDAMVARTVAR